MNGPLTSSTHLKARGRVMAPSVTMSTASCWLVLSSIIVVIGCVIGPVIGLIVVVIISRTSVLGARLIGRSVGLSVFCRSGSILLRSPFLILFIRRRCRRSSLRSEQMPQKIFHFPWHSEVLPIGSSFPVKKF